MSRTLALAGLTALFALASACVEVPDEQVEILDLGDSADGKADSLARKTLVMSITKFRSLGLPSAAGYVKVTDYSARSVAATGEMAFIDLTELSRQGDDGSEAALRLRLSGHTPGTRMGFTLAAGFQDFPADAHMLRCRDSRGTVTYFSDVFILPLRREVVIPSGDHWGEGRSFTFDQCGIPAARTVFGFFGVPLQTIGPMEGVHEFDVHAELEYFCSFPDEYGACG